MTRTPKLEYWEGKDGQWYWHLKGANGKVVCHGEGHKKKGNAIRAAKRSKGTMLVVPICGQVTVTGGVTHYVPVVTERKTVEKKGGAK